MDIIIITLSSDGLVCDMCGRGPDFKYKKEISFPCMLLQQEVGWSDKRSFLVAPRPGHREDPPLKFLSMNDISMANLVLYNRSGKLVEGKGGGFSSRFRSPLLLEPQTFENPPI